MTIVTIIITIKARKIISCNHNGSSLARQLGTDASWSLQRFWQLTNTDEKYSSKYSQETQFKILRRNTLKNYGWSWSDVQPFRRRPSDQRTSSVRIRARKSSEALFKFRFLLTKASLLNWEWLGDGEKGTSSQIVHHKTPTQPTCALVNMILSVDQFDTGGVGGWQRGVRVAATHSISPHAACHANLGGSSNMGGTHMWGRRSLE